MSLTSYSTSVTTTLPPTTSQPSTISTILETSFTSTLPSLTPTSAVSPMSSSSSGTSSSVVPTTVASSSGPPSTTSSSPALTTSSTPSLTSMSSGTVSPTTASSQSPTSASTSTITQATSSAPITSQSSIPTTTPTSSSQTTSSQTLTTSSSATTTSSSSSSSSTTTSLTPTTTSSSPTTTSSSPTTTSSSTTTSLVPTSTTSTIRTTTSSPSPTSSSSTSAPPSAPSSTSSSLVPVVTTLESTIFITTTNSAGQPMTTAPSIVTEITTSTNAAGAATTITVGVANPTLEPNNGSSSNSTFFSNTGAVVGVFVVVGLAAASIVLWIFFYIRRKSRIRRIDRDTEVEAAVAAAGFSRTLLDDDAPRSPPHSGSQYSTQMGQRNIPSYIPVGQPVSGPVLDDDNVAFNPYAGYAMESRPSAVGGGYTRARTASPPPGAERQGPSGSGTDDMGDSSRDRKSSYGHTPTYSVGSYEPLLAAYTQGTSAERGANSPPTPPPRNPQRIVDASPDHRANVNSLPGYSSDGSADARLDPEIRRRTRSDSLGSDDLRDDEDYSRPMLTVRNMPDSRSTHSAL